jgi:hypothetical protein
MGFERHGRRNLDCLLGGDLMVVLAVRRPSGMGHQPWMRGFIIAVVAGACMAGAALAFEMLRGESPFDSSPANGPTSHSIGEDVSISFGVVAVDHVTAISGLNDQQVTGAHGVAGLVQEGTIDVQVAAVITNLSDRVVAYEATQFALLDKSGTAVPIAHVPNLPGDLQPSAAIDVLLDFVTTTDARPFTVQFTDRVTNEAVLIDLGAVGCFVQSGTGRPLTVVGGCSESPTGDHAHTRSG